MKVLQVTNAQSPFFESQLAGLEAAGVTCEVCAPRTGVDGDRRARDYARFLPTVWEAAREEYDVVHANYGLTGPLALAQPRRPVVVSLWGSDVMGESRLVRRASAWATRRADAVVVPSRRLASFVEEPSYLVPFGVDTERFREIPRAEARAHVGWSTDRAVALFPYDPSRRVKNYLLAERVVEAVDGVELRTVSGVPHEEMPYYLNASDLLLVTSHRESGPMVVKEAAACNVPVVATDVGFAREVLADVEGSYVTSGAGELERAVARVVESDPGDGAGPRSNGREVVDVLSLTEMGERLRAIYEVVSS